MLSRSSSRRRYSSVVSDRAPGRPALSLSQISTSTAISEPFSTSS